MLQIKTFELPNDEDKANEFLKTHKPIGNIEFNKDMLFIGYETGEYPVEYQIADMQELLRGVRAAKFQQESALQVLNYEIADLNATHNRGRYDELTSAIIGTKKAMDVQDMKAGWLEQRIAELQAQ